MPRTMPFVLQAIRLMSKGKAAAETYLALWCNSLSDSIVEMNDRATLIAAAGYNGPSNTRIWKERMQKLAELGFIKIASGSHGDISCVIILNPHKVLRKHKEAGTAGFDGKIFNSILEQIAQYGMTDFDEKKEITIVAPPVPPTLVRPPKPKR